MSNCNATPATAEQYVSGGLSEPERAAFEEHFFECDRCLAAVQALQSAQAALAVPPSRTAAPPPARKSFSVPYTWVAVAAMLVVSVVVLSRMPRPVEPGPGVPLQPATPANPTVAAPPPTTAPSPTTNAASDLNERLTRMAAFTPPPYVSLTTRSQEDADARAFEDAMAHYSAARYDEAARGLAALASRSPRATHVLFYLGISQLMAGDVDSARASLARTIRSNEPPYSDEARFYLGKAEIRARDFGAARSALEAAVKRGAGPRREAARLIEEIAAIQR